MDEDDADDKRDSPSPLDIDESLLDEDDTNKSLSNENDTDESLSNANNEIDLSESQIGADVMDVDTLPESSPRKDTENNSTSKKVLFLLD